VLVPPPAVSPADRAESCLHVTAGIMRLILPSNVVEQFSEMLIMVLNVYMIDYHTNVVIKSRLSSEASGTNYFRATTVTCSSLPFQSLPLLLVVQPQLL
jgi:hypothetical protein